MILVGCDPGQSGALAVRDTLAKRFLDVAAMPTYTRVVGNKERPTVDEQGLVDWFQAWANAGAVMLAVELVSGVAGQSAAGAFTFGYGAGAVKAAALAARLRVAMVPSAKWKADLRVPSDKKAAVHRATELLPDYRHHWPRQSNTGDQGKAEAAMIALYAERNLL